MAVIREGHKEVLTVADDCPVTQSEVPVSRNDKKPMDVIQYELLTERPYHYNHEELIFEVTMRYKAIPPEEVAARRPELWSELFQKGHPCLRASALTKRYGWGAHYDQNGKIALYPMESAAYQQFVQAPEGIKLLGAMRNKRA